MRSNFTHKLVTNASNSATIQTGPQFIGSGSIAKKLVANHMDVQCLRTNGLLRYREWVELDQRVVRIARERLIIFDDLVSLGLTTNLGGLGVTISQYETESDLTPATVSMEADVSSQNDNLDYELNSVPVPIISKDFKLGIRQLEASRRLGSNIDLSTADVATYKVSEAAEDLIIQGYPRKIGGYRIYGLVNHPNRITVDSAGPWTTIDNIYTTVLNMLAALEAKQQFGPYRLYIAAGLAIHLYNVYPDGSGQTVFQRLQNIPTISAVKVADRLPAGTVVLVRTSSDTIDLATAQPIIPVEWDANGGLVSYFKIMMAFAPRLKPDSNGKLGVAVSTGN